VRFCTSGFFVKNISSITIRWIAADSIWDQLSR
jgi:hypothetical protein